MSGDVQPRKRKDKKRKKDELGVEEPRGTAAVFGEGDVFMHSPHEHGTGGHWCAKVIFFSLLAILITLIGLIILENRGLTDLEANSVESRYSGVLEGWLEEAPDDDHHDEHTLELKHHDDEGNENDHGDEIDHDENDEEDHDDEDHNDDDHSDEYENDNEDDSYNDEDDDNSDEGDNDDHNQDNELEDDEHNQDDDDDHNQDENDDENNQDDEDDGHQIEDDSQERSEEANKEDEVEKRNYRRVFKRDLETNDDDEDDDDDEHSQDDDDDEHSQDDDTKDEQQFEDGYSEEDNNQIFEENDDVENSQHEDDDEDEENYDFNQSIENKDEDENSNELEQNDSEARDNEDEEDHDNQPDDVEIETEKLEKEVSEEDDASSEVPSYTHFGEVDGESQEDEKDADADLDGDVEEEEFLEPEEEELPVVEHITVPAGKPLTEVEDETSSERPPDTLAEEEEYEKQQEELRREQEQASHLWLKLAVGGALLAATHALVRRATAAAARASPDTATSDEHASREETPSLIDRRMTLIMEETPVPVVPKIVPQETSKPIEREVVKKSPIVLPQKQDTKEQEVKIPITAKAMKNVEVLKDKELYSDDEDEDEEDVVETKEEVTKKSEPVKEKEPTPEPEEPEDPDDDDVEIIDDEQLEEELEEEDVEEEISDVDDAELLSRLEAKYGRLPEPERPERKHKDGGNSIEDEWPGEPSDPYWREQLDRAEEDLRQGEWSSSLERARASSEAVECSGSARARWVRARALDAAAAARRDNVLLGRAIAAYKHLLDMNDRLTDVQLRTVTERALDRIMFRGNYLGAEPIYRLLIRRFPDEPGYRNNLTVSFLMANRVDLAEEVLKDTLKRWPNDRIALAHHGFVLKTQHKRLEEAVTAFQKALEGDTGPANEARFYYHLGDALLLLGRFAEANEVHKRGSALGHFLSPAQRSLYNVNHLIGRPWWNIEDTPYIKLIRALEKSWKEILKEGEAARAVYEKEKEGLKERGEWSQLDLFVRGREIPGRCDRAPVTCSIVRAEAAASGCRRGQIKFSSMEAGTHVRPHVGPTNCRLRMHLGLSNTKNTFIRVDKETRQWKTGKVFIFDDSFEHEVWHNGTGTRLVLIVDVWHPDLTPAERQQLPAI